MIRRLGIAAATLGAILAFYVIAPTPDTPESERLSIFARDRNVAAARASVFALGDTLRALNAALERARAWETARAIAPDPALTKVITLPGLVPMTARIFEEAARAELAALQMPRVPMRVVLAPHSQSRGLYTKHAVIPQAAGQPCVVVIGISAQARNLRVARRDRILGACGFYARFGEPGSGMRAWLEETRGIAASSDSILSEPRVREVRNEMKSGEIGLVPAEAACLAGNDDACAESVLNPLGVRGFRQIIAPTERTVGVFVSSMSFYWYGPGVTLAAIRMQVGDDRFQQIWSSSQTPAEAFKTATGEHIAVFARPVLLRDVLPHTPGPLRGGLPLLLGVSIGATAAAWAISRTRRERSGT